MPTEHITLPKKLEPVFLPERGRFRYRCAYGGRGSGKSFSFALMAAVWGYAEPLRILCTRELQVSIKESFHAELKNAIESVPWLKASYDVGEHYIRGLNGTEFIFKGLRHNIGSIKSMAQIDLCIIEEAEDVPEHAWLDLLPTIRAPKSEIWVVWNRKAVGSPVDKRFIQSEQPRSIVIELNYSDNPWFPAVLDEQRLSDKENMEPGIYRHVWEGEYLKRSKAQIMYNKCVKREFEPLPHWHGPYFGLDFGFSQDPTAGVKMWICERTLYIEHEAVQVGLEIRQTAQFLRDNLPDCDRAEIKADSARPETISHLKHDGLSGVRGVKKYAGSVEDGIAHLLSYDEIVIHSRCKEMWREAELYSYKVDKLTGEVLTTIVDAHNHLWDAVRYGLEPLIKKRGQMRVGWN